MRRVLGLTALGVFTSGGLFTAIAHDDPDAKCRWANGNYSMVVANRSGEARTCRVQCSYALAQQTVTIEKTSTFQGNQTSEVGRGHLPQDAQHATSMVECM